MQHEGQGSLKASLVNLSSPAQDVGNRLTKLLHDKCDTVELYEWPDDLEIHQTTCHITCQPCGNHRWKHPELVSKYALLMKRLISDRKLAAGTLLGIHIENTTGTYLLGICQLKPARQTLLPVEVDSNTDLISYALTDKGVPEVTTLHHMLSSTLYDEPAKTINVDIFDSSCSLDVNHKMVRHAVDHREEHVLDTSQPLQQPSRAPIKLPFGIKATVRKKQKAVKKTTCKNKASAKWNGTRRRQDDATDCLEASQSSSDGMEEEELCPISEVHADQAKELKNLLTESKKDEEARAKAHVAFAAGRTFFAAEIGLLNNAELAKSNRSKCYACKTAIARGAVRFPWQYDKLRPHAWMHGTCIPGLARKINLVAATLTNMTQLHEISSCPMIKADAKNVIVALSGSPGPAASS